MRTLTAAILMMVVAATARSADIVSDDEFVRQSWSLLAEAKFGQSDGEHAAFIVRERDGRLRFEAWPFDGRWRQAEFHGRIPSSAIAIIHTHPNSRPAPSADDAATALRVGMPIYVLTRTLISRTDGTRTEILRSGDWQPRR